MYIYYNRAAPLTFFCDDNFNSYILAVKSMFFV